MVPVGDRVIVGATHEYDPEHFDAPTDAREAEAYLLPKGEALYPPLARQRPRRCGASWMQRTALPR